MLTLMEEIKPVVLGKNEFEYREKTKIKISSWEFSNHQDSDAKEKNKGFWFEYSSINAVFSIDILMEEI